MIDASSDSSLGIVSNPQHVHQTYITHTHGSLGFVMCIAQKLFGEADALVDTPLPSLVVVESGLVAFDEPLSRNVASHRHFAYKADN